MEKASERTRKKLMDAFWSLYKDKGIENMTITEVVKVADCRRSTFYRYFKNLREVLLAIEDELLRELDMPIMDLVFSQNTRDDEQAIRHYKEYFERWGEYYKVLLGQRGDAGFLARLVEFTSGRESFSFGMNNLEKADQSVMVGALNTYHYAGAMAVVGYWVDHREEMSANDMRELLYFCYGIER